MGIHDGDLDVVAVIVDHGRIASIRKRGKGRRVLVTGGLQPGMILSF